MSVITNKLQARALAAYYSDGEVEDLSPLDVCERMSAGLNYVVLSRMGNIVAVYRVRPSGVLKRMKRWSLQ